MATLEGFGDAFVVGRGTDSMMAKSPSGDFFFLAESPSGILVPSAGLEPGPSSMKGQSRNQKTAREFARGPILKPQT